ncbi:hypothetical protein [Capillimicrobium parvum]|uniref:hypothetical protein n=1 Tax=Capillimicrobium parvum TaxID=2884022 RepID=UPI00216AF6DE|nr:hypothetical protein [Capillimicrobium parvum]
MRLRQRSSQSSPAASFLEDASGADDGFAEGDLDPGVLVLAGVELVAPDAERGELLVGEPVVVAEAGQRAQVAG